MPSPMRHEPGVMTVGKSANLKEARSGRVICEDLADDLNDKVQSAKPSNITECFLYQYVKDIHIHTVRY